MSYRSYHFREDCFRTVVYLAISQIALLSLRPHLLHAPLLWMVQSLGASILVLTIVYLQRQHSNTLSHSVSLIDGTRVVQPEKHPASLRNVGIGIAPYSRGRHSGFIHIEAEDENKHGLLVGDTGTGKSAIIHTLLHQIRIRAHETVFIYDPSLEFWQHHGDPEHGDILLAPELSQCPYWHLVEELASPQDVHNMTESFIPDRIEGPEDFWEGSSRKVLAELFTVLVQRQGGVGDLKTWLNHPRTLVSLLKHSTVDTILNKDAKGQRAGVLATLSLIERALSYLPERDGRPTFSFHRWLHTGQPGWVFLGARGIKNQHALRPLFSAWIETASRELTTQRRKPTWVIIDEFPSLQRLKVIPEILTQGRKTDLKIVLSFQGKSQVEHRYGKEAESMLSAPKTKIFLRNSNFESATWCAKTIGMPLNQRETASYSHQPLGGISRDSVTYRIDHREEYLVVPNQIQTLEDRQGYVLYRKSVVPFCFHYPELTVRNHTPSAELLPAVPLGLLRAPDGKQGG